jgi:hypothetical protein
LSNFDKEWILFGPETGYSVPGEAVEGLYFIYCEDPKSIKIGISTTPLSRLSNLGSYCSGHSCKTVGWALNLVPCLSKIL